MFDSIDSIIESRASFSIDGGKASKGLETATRYRERFRGVWNCVSQAWLFV